MESFSANWSTNVKKVSIRVIKVDESYTSQTCSICGTVDKTSRVDRGLYVCKHCDVVMNADVNGAYNICDTGPTLLALFNPICCWHVQDPFFWHLATSLQSGSFSPVEDKFYIRYFCQGYELVGFALDFTRVWEFSLVFSFRWINFFELKVFREIRNCHCRLDEIIEVELSAWKQIFSS